MVTPPGNSERFAEAVARLLDDAQLRARLGLAARGRALERWGRTGILARFEQQLREFVG